VFGGIDNNHFGNMFGGGSSTMFMHSNGGKEDMDLASS